MNQSLTSFCYAIKVKNAGREDVWYYRYGWLSMFERIVEVICGVINFIASVKTIISRVELPNIKSTKKMKNIRLGLFEGSAQHDILTDNFKFTITVQLISATVLVLCYRWIQLYVNLYSGVYKIIISGIIAICLSVSEFLIIDKRIEDRWFKFLVYDKKWKLYLVYIVNGVWCTLNGILASWVLYKNAELSLVTIFNMYISVLLYILTVGTYVLLFPALSINKVVFIHKFVTEGNKLQSGDNYVSYEHGLDIVLGKDKDAIAVNLKELTIAVIGKNTLWLKNRCSSDSLILTPQEYEGIQVTDLSGKSIVYSYTYDNGWSAKELN